MSEQKADGDAINDVEEYRRTHEHEKAEGAAIVIDCGDNSCLFATNKGGMRTNGGCHCYERAGFGSSAVGAARKMLPEVLRLRAARAAAKAEGERIGYEAAMSDAAAFEADPSGKTIAKLPHLARLLATFREAAERAEAGGYDRGKADERRRVIHHQAQVASPSPSPCRQQRGVRGCVP